MSEGVQAMARRGNSSGGALMKMFRDSIIAMVCDDTEDLSARQLGVLLRVYTEDNLTQTVRVLAETLGVSKPAISRALDRLEKMGYVKRKIDPFDRRSVLVQRTPEGKAYFGTIEAYLRDAAKAAEEGDDGDTAAVGRGEEIDEREVDQVSARRGTSRMKKKKDKEQR